MNIAFDALALLGKMSKNRGIGNYSYNQFKTLIELDKNNKYFFFNLLEECDLFSEFGDIANFQEDYFYCGKDNFLLVNENYKDILGALIKKYINKNKIDVFWITSPFDDHMLCYQKDWFSGIKVVATVYDIIPYVMKKQYLSDKNTYNWYMKCVDMLRWVDKILVISQSVKDDLIKYLNFPEDKIEVIWGGVDNRYKSITISEKNREAICNKYGIKNQFIMCTGGDDDRKNISGLIEAYSKLPHKLINEYQLVIVCKLSPNAVEKYSRLISKLGINGRVILTNFVTDYELLQIYNLAYLMAFPSKYEGFGLPIVEAWACGTPVLTSNNSSLIQIAGDAAIIVDPFDVNNITQKLEQALTENLDHLILNGKKRLNLFKWEHVTKNTIEIINNIDTKVYNIEKNNTYKLAFFTPLPPLKSGISDYSTDILNELCKYFDIDVIIDDKYTPNCNLAKNIQIINHRNFIAHKYDYIIYQIGNSLYHTYMWDYIKKYSGIIVLHDYNLHGVAQAVSLSKLNDKELYEKYLLDDYNKETVSLYLDQLNRGGPMKIYEYELNGFLVNCVDKIIVHSDYSKEKLLIKNFEKNIITIPHYVRIEKLVDNLELKKNLGINQDTIVFSSFGHIHETKRAIPIIKAFAKLAEDYDNVMYSFVGQLDPAIEYEFKDLIINLNLQNKVEVTGYVSLEKFENYIDLSDVCLNLRYPYNGETSGSLMRILSKGKSVIVNNIGSFKEIPSNACIKIPSVDCLSQTEEIDEIYMAMKQLITDKKTKISIEHNARKYAEDVLDIKKVGLQYRDFILNDNKYCISRNDINNIKNYEIINKKYTCQETKALSKTLSYIKIF